MKKALLLILIIIEVFLLSACSESDRTYATGLELSADGRYTEALKMFERAESQGEKGAGLCFDMAFACLCIGEEERADELYRKGMDRLKDGLHGREALKAGRFLQKEEKNDEAVSIYLNVFSEGEETSRKDPEIGNEARGYYGTALMATGEDYEKAIQTFNFLIDGGFYPMEHEILAGACYLKLSQIQAACQYFDLAAARKEIRPEHFLRIYRLLYDAAAYTPAENYLQKGLLLCGKNGGMSEREYLIRAGKAELSEACEKEKEDVDTLILMGSLLTEQGEYERAEEVYQELLLRGEKLPRVYCDYMRLKVVTGAYDNALQLYTEVLQTDDPEILSEGAWNEIILYERKGDFRTAYEKITAYRKRFETTEEIRREYVFLERVLGE